MKKTTRKVATKKLKADYILTVKLNDEIFSIATKNLFDAIKSLAPKVLKTKVLFKITRLKDNAVCERQVFVLRGKQIFRNKMFLETFIRQLIFKTNNG